MEDQQKDLVEKVRDGIAGMHVQITVSKKELATIGAVVAIGAAVGTGLYLGGRHLVYVTKRKLKERKEQKGWFK